MGRAYILATTAVGEADSVLVSALEADGVAEGHIVSGDYDVVLEVDAPDVSEVLRSVVTGVRDIEGVVDTRTYIRLG
ncbi:MAG: Lrp/AsnC ligand binding domain-containing protein [Haloarculaceae archaeon]